MATMLDSPDLDRGGEGKRKRRGETKVMNKDLREYDIQDHPEPTTCVHKGLGRVTVTGTKSHREPTGSEAKM